MTNVTSTIPKGRRRHGSARELIDFLGSGAQLTNAKEEVTTGAEPTTANLGLYETDITTGGSEGEEVYALGLNAVVGQRKLVKLILKIHEDDELVLDFENIVNAEGTQTSLVELQSADDFIMLEWTGNKWKIIYTNAMIALE